MTSVKHFHSAMTGAPVLSGTAGSLIAVLDACLVNGFGLQTATSLVVARGIATLTFPSGHSFEQDAIALVAGATPSGLNGEKRILTTTTNTATFDATGISDQTATGTITAKMAPAGWVKEFSGTNLAAYRASNVESTRMYLRVDDTGTTNSRVVGYETMSDVNTGVGPFPTTTQISGGGWWPKANAANATARAWTVVADSKGLILHIHAATSSPGIAGGIWSFGDFASLKSGDAYACVLHCTTSDQSNLGSASSQSLEWCYASTGYGGNYLPRSFTMLGGSVAANHLAPDFVNPNASGYASQSGSPLYPNGPDNGLVLSKKVIVEVGVCRRGTYRGMYITPQNCSTAFSWRDKIDGHGELTGRKLMALKCGSPAATTNSGVVFVDITGPW